MASAPSATSASEAGAFAAVAVRPRGYGAAAASAGPAPDSKAPEFANEFSPLADKNAKVTEALANLTICETLDELQGHFGWEFLVMLSIAQHVVKGFVETFTQPCRRFLLAAYKVPGPQMQIYTSVSQLPWAMKPVVGCLSDAFPIAGYHKLPYMFMASVWGIFGCACIGFTTGDHLSVVQLVVCFFLVEQMVTVTDLLTEAKYAEKMRQQPTHGPALASFVWFGLNLGALVAAASVGFIMSKFGIHSPFIIAIFPMSTIFIPLLRNYMHDHPRNAEEMAAFRAQMLEQKEVYILCFLMFIGTVSLTITGLMSNKTQVNAIAALIVATVVLVSFSLMLRPIIAKVNAYFLIQSSLCLSIEGASFYFYTDPAMAYPEGPQFSMSFYVSILGVFGALFSLLGIWSYNRYATGWTYRQVLLTTNVVISVLYLLDVILFTRTNIKLGIPDHYFVLGSSVFETVIRQWQWMPGVILNSQLCPAGMEATMYGLLVGSNNLGLAIAQNCGAYVLEILGCAPNGSPGETSQFDNLWVASLISTILPAFTLLLIPVLIPNVRQTDKLLDDNDRDPTEGSVWRRWMAS